MKVILLQNVPELGEAGEIKEVALGYARNFLLPKGLAQEATEQKVKEIEAQREREAKLAEADLAKTEQLVQRLEGQVIEITAKASAGTLYAAIPPARIAAALKEKGFEVRKEQIKVAQIKEVGEHEVILNLDHGLEARITLIVNSE